MNLLHKKFLTGPIQAQKGSIIMRNVISNAFSLSMISDLIWEDKGDNFAGLPLSFKEIQPDAIPDNIYSVIGHADTARVIGNIIGREVPVNRETYKAQPGDTIYVAQYIGPRLPEGATQLPEGAEIRFYKIQEVQPDIGALLGAVPFIGNVD